MVGLGLGLELRLGKILFPLKVKTNDPSLEAQDLRLSSHLKIIKKGQVFFGLYHCLFGGVSFDRPCILDSFESFFDPF